MRTRLQALLSSTALAGAIAVAALMSSGSVRFANADAVTDTVRDMMTAMMNSQSAAIPEATRTAVGSLLNSTSDSATLMAQLDSLAGQNAALAETIGSALGKASLSLQLSNPVAANEIHSFISSASNSNLMSGYNAAQRPITAQNLSASSGVLIAQNLDVQNNPPGSDIENFLNSIQTFGGGAPGNTFTFSPTVFSAQFLSFNRQVTFQVQNFIAKTFQVGPYSGT